MTKQSTTAGKLLALLLVFTHFLLTAQFQNKNIVNKDKAFITKWKTDNLGTSDDNQITIPVVEDEEYDYYVDWGDGTFDLNVSESITHTYQNSGEYQVSIKGKFPRIFFNNKGDKEKSLPLSNGEIFNGGV